MLTAFGLPFCGALSTYLTRVKSASACSLGVEAVPGVGSLFDPNLHDAIMRAPSVEAPDDTILEEFRKGFRIGDRLLRPAMVKVSFRPEGAAAEEEAPAEAAAAGGSSTE